jgi:hypothetical protein
MEAGTMRRRGSDIDAGSSLLRAAPRRLLVLGSMLVAVPTLALAADPPERKGFWAAFGGGYGSAQVRCQDCVSGSRLGSFNGTLRLGGTLGKHWLLGWEASGWLKNNDSAWLPLYGGLDRTLGTSTVVAFYYPGSESRFWVKAGAGLSYAGFSSEDLSCSGLLLCQPIERAHGVGLALTAGLGYDVRLNRKLSLTPELSLVLGLSRDISDDGVLITRDWSHDVWALNLCLTFH